MNKILVVEDEEPIAHLICMSLQNAGYSCDVAVNGLEGADRIQKGEYDLCLLDIMLPGIDGFDLLEYAKSADMPVIFITAVGDTETKVRGLRAGADDYLVKPFEVMELIARVESVLRRREKISPTMDVLDLHIDIISRTVTKNGVPLKLTFKEFELLTIFARHPNMALKREMIYENVWGTRYTGDSRTVDLHVQRLRKKTGLGDHLESIYKVGYRLVV